MIATTQSNALAMKAVTADSTTLRMAMYAGLTGLGVMAITLAAKTQVPFWPVPMTLQTFAIMAIAAAYGMRLGTATVLAYLAAGFAGMPVFAGPVAGPLYFAGPTAGFLAGFIVIALMVGAAADRGLARSPFRIAGVMLAADVVCFALGFVWLAYFFVAASGNTLGAETAFAAAVKPYVLSDLVKIALAAALVPALGALFARR